MVVDIRFYAIHLLYMCKHTCHVICTSPLKQREGLRQLRWTSRLIAGRGSRWRTGGDIRRIKRGRRGSRRGEEVGRRRRKREMRRGRREGGGGRGRGRWEGEEEREKVEEVGEMKRGEERGRWRMKWGGGRGDEEEVGRHGQEEEGEEEGNEEGRRVHGLINCATITVWQTSLHHKIHKRRHSPIASMSIMNGTALLFPTALMDTIIASYITFGTSPQISIVVSLPNAVSITVTGVELVELGRVKVMIN